jgi:pyruvate dehydrogenase E2 component (dihydrolipoamide acetyltransferase)
MAEIVKMPKLSDTMTEGVVAKWHKKVGDKVKNGELLADIETDKATMEFESFQDGVLLYCGVEQGKAAPVDSVLAILGKEGEDITALIEEAKKGAVKPAEVVTEQKKPEVKKEEATRPAVVMQEVVQAQSVHVPSNGTGDSRLKASPLARKLAEEKGIDIHIVRGSGDLGRVVKRDVENYKGGGMTMPDYVGVESFTEEPVSQMRKTIARRLAESKFSAPHFYLTMEIEMDEIIKARESINSVSPVKISFNDLVIKAVSAALRQNMKVNSSWLGDKIRYNNHIHIGVAVAVEDGLLVPVIRFADGKTLSQISAEVKEFARKAKEKKLQPSDWEGNTFTISNLGMFGIDQFTAIINPPDACILAIGGITPTALVKNGQVVAGNLMKVTLSCDHRVVDGATGSGFLKSLKHFLENPVLLLGAMSI